MKNVTTYIHFDGNCREAMQFYQKCLGGEIQLMAMPDDTGKPSSDPNVKIMHSELSRNGQPVLMGSDGCPAGTHKPGNNFSVAIECESIEELERLFTAVSENGHVILPPSDVPWGARFGMFTDRFGVQWMLNCPLGG